MLGGRLMAALQQQAGTKLRFSGVGGPEMQRHGLHSLFSYTELSIMGLVEVLPKARHVMRRMREVAQAIGRDPPDVLVTIDAPGFCVGVVKRLRGHEMPRVHYVAPTVWAWRPGRVYKFKRHFDHLLALFPFEPQYFKAARLPCTFVGHAVVEARPPPDAGPAFRRRHGVGLEAQLLCVLPGSRRGEVGRLLMPFGATVALLAAAYPGLCAVVPTVPQMADAVRAAVATWPVCVAVVEAPTDRLAAMSASNVALAASGTVALELAVCRVPTVIAYKVAPMTHWILRRLVRVSYVNIVNILADKAIVPEFIQGNCVPERLAPALKSIMSSPERRSEILAAQDRAVAQLGGEGTSSPSAMAATAVLRAAATWQGRGAN